MNDRTGPRLILTIWLALVVAVLITSWFAYNVINQRQNDRISHAVGRLTISYLFRGNLQTDQEIATIEYVRPTLYIVLGTFTMLTWWRFADLTMDMLVSAARGTSSVRSVLVFPLHVASDEESDADPQRATTTTVGGVLRTIGYTWIVIVLMPQIITLLERALES
jgi:hypothetical protein